MWPVESPFPGGTVGVPCGTTPRYLDFEHSLEGLKVSARTLSLRMPGSNVTLNCNAIVDQMKGEWLFILGDDHAFDPDLLLRLLKHDVDVVVPVCCRRGPPFLPVLYKEVDIRRGACEAYTWDELDLLSGLITVAGAGSAGMLIKRRVIDALPKPTFENWTTPDGQTAGEDVTLSQKIVEAGFEIHADLDTVIDHITPVSLRPVKRNGRWEIAGIYGRRRGPDGIEREMDVIQERERPERTPLQVAA